MFMIMTNDRYTVKYSQRVGSEDMYLGLSGKRHGGLVDADELQIEIQMPETRDIQSTTLDITRKYLQLNNPN